MKEISLNWVGPFYVTDMEENFRLALPVFDLKYPDLKSWGFYMFLDEHGIVDIGSASGKGRALRTRLKNETSIKSAFFGELEEIGVDRKTLQLKVGILIEATENGNKISLVDPYDIEFALICKGDPRINTHGIKRYRHGDIEIINKGNFAPLPQRFVTKKGEKCHVSPT
jgi:hypothetical protein